jgi:hypothetical protein
MLVGRDDARRQCLVTVRQRGPREFGREDLAGERRRIDQLGTQHRAPRRRARRRAEQPARRHPERRPQAKRAEGESSRISRGRTQQPVDATRHEDAERGAEGIGDDVAHRGIPSGNDRVLEHLDAEREREADEDGARQSPAEQAETEAEGQQHHHVLQHVLHADVAADEAPDRRQLAALRFLRRGPEREQKHQHQAERCERQARHPMTGLRGMGVQSGGRRRFSGRRRLPEVRHGMAPARTSG